MAGDVHGGRLQLAPPQNPQGAVCLNAGNRAKTKALRLAAELCRAAKTFSKDYETIKTRPELTNRGFFQQAPRIYTSVPLLTAAKP
jgi:hypothetical protein